MKKVIISGYSSGEKDALGIFDLLKTDPVWSSSEESPSFLCLHGEECFAASEREESGTFYCFVKDKEGYRLSDSVTLEGGALCHIWYSPRHQTLYGAFYSTGHVTALRVENHRFVEVLNHFSIDRDGYPLTRAHCCVPDPAEEYAFVCNIAQDRVYSYKICDGKLSPNQTQTFVQLPKGVGPRHICFLPDGKTAYVITEYSNEIYILDCDPKKGTLSVRGCVLVPSEDFSGETFCSGMAFSSDFKFLYGANRGANTISVFAVEDDGGLVKIQEQSCGGNWPRHIALSKDGQVLLSANQRSGEVSFLKLCPETGRIGEVLSQIPFDEPSFAMDLEWLE